MKVLLVSHGVTDQSMLGGPGRIAASQANALVVRGNEVTVVTTDATAKGVRTPAPTFGLLDPRVEVHCLAGRTLKRWPGTIGPVFHPGSRELLLRAVSEAEVVHCHEWPHLLIQQARSIARAMRKACVIQPHGSIQPRVGANRLLHRAFVARYPASPDEVLVAGTDAEAREIRHELGSGVAIRKVVNPVSIPSVDPASSAAMRKGWAFPTASIAVLYAHRIYPSKGLDLLIDSLSRLPERFHLAVVGPVGDSSFLRRCHVLVARVKAVERVRFLGPSRSDQMPEVLSAADIFVLPARRDTFPMSVLEAMACARPVVMTSTCQSVEVLGSAVAAVEPTPEDIARGIASLLDAERRRDLGDRARRLVATEFSPELVAEALELVYRSAISSRAFSSAGAR